MVSVVSELRFNPLLGDWTMVAANRQKRPDMPKDDCPFCPGSGKVPNQYDVFKYDNDFPVLSHDPSQPSAVATGIYRTAPAYGRCEVILYSSDHHATLPQLSVSHIRKVVDLWTERFAELSADRQHKYVFIFENRGREVGVTMPHPHGQVYAYPYVPGKIRTELAACKTHHDQTGHCLLCDINKEEQKFAQRMLVTTKHFISYLPFFTDYPYGAFISSLRHKANLLSFTDDEKDDLAYILKLVTAGMDHLFDKPFPYMMALHQTPVHDADAADYYHFHIEFYPPLRDRDRVKFLASSETGAWAPANPTAVEDTAVILRNSIQQIAGGMAQ